MSCYFCVIPYETNSSPDSAKNVRLHKNTIQRRCFAIIVLNLGPLKNKSLKPSKMKISPQVQVLVQIQVFVCYYRLQTIYCFDGGSFCKDEVRYGSRLRISGERGRIMEKKLRRFLEWPMVDGSAPL